MKKLLVVLALVLVFSVIFVACNKTEEGTPETTTVAENNGTEAPTTKAPEVDGTEAPTTEAPTTEEPTEAPTTEAPTTEAPTTEAPTTEAPTEGPTTEEPTEEPTGEEPTTEEPTTEEPTTEEPTTEEPPVVEEIRFIGALADINGLGPNGKKFSMTNNYTTYAPHSNNPNVVIYPPAIGGWDYTCRRFSLNGWAMLEGGNGEMVWSYDGGKTWLPIADVTYSDQDFAKLKAFADTAGFATYEESYVWDANFVLTIDLTEYFADDEYVTIWVGRKSVNGTPVVIYKFGEILTGEEAYVPEIEDGCGNVSRDDVKHPVTVVDFSLFESNLGVQDSKGRFDRIRVGTLNGVDTNCGNNVAWQSSDRIIQLLEKDLTTASHYFQIEGWVALVAGNLDLEMSINVIRNGEITWSKNTTDHYTGGTNYKNEVTCFKYCDKDFRNDIYYFNLNGPSANPYSAFYSARLYTSILQDGDSVHLVLKDRTTGVSYCFNYFTIKVVADNTDLTVDLAALAIK